jgi:uncharacterized protein
VSWHPASPRLLFAALLMLAPAAAHADTLLRLSETATVVAHPDELEAALRVEVVSPNAADAQRRVNAAMADALAAAKAVAGVTVGSGGYFVWRVSPPQDRPERWQANQSLTLTSHDGAALLKLVGELQQKGLLVGQLGWHLSDAAEHTAQADATRNAIAALRGRADDAAALLDLRFGSFKEVRLNGTRPQPIMLQRAIAMPMSVSAAASPPSAEPADVTVSATAEADVELLPK